MGLLKLKDKLQKNRERYIILCGMNYEDILQHINLIEIEIQKSKNSKKEYNKMLLTYNPTILNRLKIPFKNI